jgi:UDP-2,3-diacylglucosamine hydrolase
MVPSSARSYLRPMPIQQLVVVGDAHLGAAPPVVEATLLRWLDEVPKLGDGLLLNGDLFAFWFGYRRAIPRAGVRVLARLAALARSMPVLMTGGNHDRWGDSFWEPELGIRFGRSELAFELDQRPALAVHGDGVAEPTWKTALKLRVIGHPMVSAGFRALPADLAFRWADRLNGRLERTDRSERRADRAALLQRTWAAERLRDRAELSLLVMGHTHRPAVAEPVPGQRYLNPGAWFDGYRYATATATEVTLRQYPG